MPAMPLRQEDAIEVRGFGFSPGRALRSSWRRSFYRRAAALDGTLVAAWGVVGTPGGTGQSWLLTSPPIERMKVTMLQIARDEVANMLDIFPRVWGLVSADYTKAIRFLGAVGFTIEPAPVIIPRTGAKFLAYWIER